jgi:hypothetical protein
MATGFVFVKRQLGISQTLGSVLFSGRMEAMMMALTVLRRRGLMMPQQTLRRRQLIWTLMDILLRTLLVLQRCQLLRWL